MSELERLVKAVLDARAARRPNESSFVEDVNCGELADYVAEHLTDWLVRERLEVALVKAKRALSAGTADDPYGNKDLAYIMACRDLERWLLDHVETD